MISHLKDFMINSFSGMHCFQLLKTVSMYKKPLIYLLQLTYTFFNWGMKAQRDDWLGVV